MALYVIGSATLDRQVRADGFSQTALGGVVTYGGITFARHGLTPHVLFYYAADRMEQVQQVYKDEKIVPHGVIADKNTIFINKIDVRGGRTQVLQAMAPPIATGHAGVTWMKGDHVHLGPLHASDIHADVFDTLDEVYVTLDVQGYIRGSNIGPVEKTLSPLLEIALSMASIVKADVEEWAFIRTHLGFKEHEMLEAFGIDELVITQGDVGGFVQTWTDLKVSYLAAPVKRMVDSTGAGDVFFAAYLYHRHYAKASIVEASRAAAKTAALQVSDQYIRRATLGL